MFLIFVCLLWLLLFCFCSALLALILSSALFLFYCSCSLAFFFFFGLLCCFCSHFFLPPCICSSFNPFPHRPPQSKSHHYPPGDGQRFVLSRGLYDFVISEFLKSENGSSLSLSLSVCLSLSLSFLYLPHTPSFPFFLSLFFSHFTLPHTQIVDVFNPDLYRKYPVPSINSIRTIERNNPQNPSQTGA